MNVYFFSRHTASQKMIADLGGTITNQFTGTISNIKRVGNSIEFLELQEKCVTKHLIDVDSIIVAVAPEDDASSSAFPIVASKSVAVVDSVSGRSNESFNEPPNEIPIPTTAMRATK